MVAERRLSSSAVAQVMRVRPFRRLWLVLGLSSLGDWLGLLATSAFASAQMSSPVAQGATFGGVIVVQLLPSLFLGPLGGVLADRFDRRRAMVVVDVARFLLFASIPAAAVVVDNPGLVVGWAGVASFAAQLGAMVWNPAKDAAVPNLLPRDRLEIANQLTLITTYGVTPVLAALAFSAAARMPSVGRTDAAAYALYFDALTFLTSAAVVFFGVPEISGRAGAAERARESFREAVGTGWRYMSRSRLLRGLIAGVLGSFAGAGTVVGAARFYSRSLGGGDAAFGLLFGGLFVGFGLGVLAGPTISGWLSRRLTFGLAVQLAGVAVVLLSITTRLAIALAEVVVVGIGAGAALLYGVTIMGAEVDDAVRGRVFAVVQTSAKAVLLLATAMSSTLAGVTSFGSRLLYAAAGCCGVVVGAIAVHQMSERPGVSLRRILRDATGRGRPRL
ncbi:MFS transporter [Actinoplanes sp. NPDC049316]|uniref:MFS transporter n=1 Tax=Actinoplanes sp. NPDC049316 TaxID=3154727 RepID=UPI00342EDA57